MRSFEDDDFNADEERKVEEAREMLEPHTRYFQDQLNSLTDTYTESVARLFGYCNFNGSDLGNEPNHDRDETDKALERLLLSALKLSQALIEKYIQKMQQK